MIDNEARFYAKFIKRLRKEEGLSLKKFGELFEVSGQTILDIENGKNKKPNKKLITSISKYKNIEESKIYNEIYYGKSNYKSSPFNQSDFFKSLLELYCENKKVDLDDETELFFEENIRILYEYLISLKSDWLMRYDEKQIDYMVRTIHYFDRRNIVYIITWDFAQIKYDFHIKNRQSTSEIENIFLHSMFEIMKSKKEKPRTFTILFDAKNEIQLYAYKYLTSLEFKAPKFFIQFVLYDVESNTSEEKVYK